MAAEVGDDLWVSPALTIPAAELGWRFSRSSGAGGQHVNTSDTRVEMSWNVADSEALSATQRSRAIRNLRTSLVDGVLTVAASDRRSQLRNREIARARLADTVAEAIAPPPPPRRATRPSRASQQRRVEAKKRRSQTKQLRQRPTD
ncbi:alternative ribosome rescue aminoacyl-tRNA hydrolase ArfB [soil metagenome]